MTKKREQPAAKNVVSASLDATKAVTFLRKQIDAAIALRARLDELGLNQWIQTSRGVVVGAFGEPSDVATRFDKASKRWMPGAFYASSREFADERADRLEALVGVLKSGADLLMMGLGGTVELMSSSDVSERLNAMTAKLTFLNDENIDRLVKRDLAEIGVCVTNGAWKAALLLCGSSLEAVLIDVLDRRRDIAAACLPKVKRFPDDASLSQLISVAGDPNLVDNGGYLLSKTATGFAGTITEHRDLIHPHAELRGRITVDQTTTMALIQLLELVLRDLSAADARGDIAAYVAK